MEVVRLNATHGARVTGVDLRKDIDRFAEALRDALYEHKVIVIPQDVGLTDLEQRKVADIFGDSRPHIAVSYFRGEDQFFQMVENDADRPPSQDGAFHSDYAFSEHIPKVGVLQAIELPSRGGDTVWTDMEAALAALSPSLRDYLRTLTATHTQGKVNDHLRQRHGDKMADELIRLFPPRSHPLVVRHPVTGREGLFIGNYASHIDGLTRKESQLLLGFLMDHIATPHFIYRHHWTVHDIVIWDELSTAHLGPADYYPERRVLRRITAGLVSPGGESTERQVA